MKRLLQSRPLARTQHGVALLECLMALLIFSVGLLGLLGLEARVMNISVDSEDRNRAAMFASEVASQMWLNNTVAPASADYTALLGNVADQTKGGVPGGVVTVTPVVGTTNAADINVTWQQTSDPAGNTSTLTTRVILP
ncbi:MAG TPA: prepilin-type N-terminal cleavage/methylation domain-containing protein [Steroidobacteraceae bacterium]|jgi:type IV pilus assembly protein PilV|nr:prepilin-type N-terminal cleavage/methylation domain-containing protein [Steroidobacteraceae bacterium]